MTFAADSDFVEGQKRRVLPSFYVGFHQILENEGNKCPDHGATTGFDAKLLCYLFHTDTIPASTPGVNLLAMTIREGVTFAGAGGPVTLGAYPTWVWSDAIDCENFLQAVFELHPGTVTGGLYYTLEFQDSDTKPVGNAGWQADPIDQAGTAVNDDFVIPVGRQVRTWSGSTPILVNTPLPHRWVRIGLAAGTDGAAQVIIKRLALSSR